MPCPSWSISARHCITGQQLRSNVPNSPCAKCYALKGHFTYKSTEVNNERRLLAYYQHSNWASLLARLINLSVPVGNPYFRWFSSGDLQSLGMLRAIASVCEQTPHVKHWLPTQEREMLSQYLESEVLPPNLVVRVSSTTINGVPTTHTHNSVVISDYTQASWAKRVKRNTFTRFSCPSSLTPDHSCGTCRACWDSRIRTICYKLH